MDDIDDNDSDDYLPVTLEDFGCEGSHCWKNPQFSKSSTPPRSQLLHFSIAQSTHLSIFTLQTLYNSFLLKLHAVKYFQHYENLKHSISATNTTHTVGEKGNSR